MRIILQTPRLIIREFSPDEREVYLTHFTDEEVVRYIPKRSRDERINIFNTILANYASNDKLRIWGMFSIADSDFIGSCLLRPFKNQPGKTELGYSMEKKYWGKGIATEMALAMVDLAFKDEDTEAVVAVTELPNIASQRVLEKAGMKRIENIKEGEDELAYFEINRTF